MWRRYDRSTQIHLFGCIIVVYDNNYSAAYYASGHTRSQFSSLGIVECGIYMVAMAVRGI